MANGGSGAQDDDERPTVKIQPDDAAGSDGASPAVAAGLPPALPTQAAIRTRYQTLPNAIAGLHYAVRIDVVEPGRPVKITEVHGLDVLNLSVDAETGLLGGVPSAEGEHRIEIVAVAPGPGGVPARTRWVATLTVNPDPRSLWRDLPSDRSDPFWKEDAASARVVAGGRLLLAASKRGRSHAHAGKFRDDDVRISAGTPEDWNILAVADGAGSGRLSRLGSRIACETVIAELPALLRQNLEPTIEALAERHARQPGGNEIDTALYQSVVRAAFLATKALGRAAEELGQPQRDLATTLLVVVHRKTQAGHFFAGFGIGDGVAAVLDLESSSVIPLTQPDSGAYAGQTRFLAESEFTSSTRLMERLRFTLLTRFTAAVAMTDGVSDAKFPTEADLVDPAAWDDVWARDLARSVRLAPDNPYAEHELLEWLDFWSTGNHDDRTIALLV